MAPAYASPVSTGASKRCALERAFLLEQLNKHMEYNVDDSDRSSSPPPTPTDKPLRSKRSHNRKGTPPAGATAGSSGAAPAPHQSPGSTTQHHNLLHQMPLSSAQSTPDPSRQSTSYFNTIGAAASSPHAPNGAPVLPPLHSLPQIQPTQQPAPPRAAYFDPAYDDQRPAPAEAEGETGRRRAYSGAQPPAAEAAPPQNGDTEMTDASFAAASR